MADEVCAVQYVYVTVKDRPGEGAKVLGALKKARVNLLAFSGFPGKAGKAQIDLVTEQNEDVKRVARDCRWKLSPVKHGFLVQGKDKVGAVADIMAKLAKARVNVTAADAVAAGGGRFGMILWVKKASRAKAAKVLKAW